MRILVAEDDPGIGELLDVILTGLDHVVTVTADGSSAIAAFEGGSFDLVLLDVMMPSQTGFDVARAVRSSPKGADVAIVMLTAQSSEDAHVRGFEHGADAYLTKPFRPRDLEERLREIVAMSPDERARLRANELDRALLLRRLEGRF